VRTGIRDPAFEEDVLAETLSQISADGARALRTYRGESGLGTFLSVIAGRITSRSIGRRRAEVQARQAAAERARRSADSGAAADQSSGLEERERAATFTAALGDLKPRDRTLLALFHQDGRSYQEIGAALGMPVNGVGV